MHTCLGGRGTTYEVNNIVRITKRHLQTQHPATLFLEAYSGKCVDTYMFSLFVTEFVDYTYVNAGYK